jgi:hypothetical protein
MGDNLDGTEIVAGLSNKVVGCHTGFRVTPAAAATPMVC